MIFYIYRNDGGRWSLVDRSSSQTFAEKIARAQCPRGQTVETERSGGLRRGLFTVAGRRDWIARITLKEIGA